MNSSIPKQLLHDLSRVITTHTGLSYPPQKWNSLNKGLAAAASENGFDDPQSYARKILKSPSPAEMLEPLIGRLTVGETYFFRDKHIFQILQDHILRGLIEHPRRAEKSIRFWSAGCATGEEAYSIAILIDRMGGLPKPWNIQIIGTDINQQFLKIAEQGIYSRWSLRETPVAITRHYFIQQSNSRFELIPAIREKVKFTRLNFAEPDYKRILGSPDPMDVIFCRNVLMYHEAMTRRHVINNLIELMADNGWLITGPAESGFVDSDELTPVRFSHAIFFRKGPARKEEKYPLTHGKKRQTGTLSARGDPLPSQKPSSQPPNRRITDIKTIKKTSLQETYEDARSDYDRHRYKEASEKLDRILAKGRSRNGSFLMRTDAMVLLARCYANLGKLHNAEHWCHAAIETEKLNPEHYFLLSTIYQAGNNRDAAIRALKRALYLDPDFVMGLFQLGILLKQKGRFEESRKRFSSAISILKGKDPEEILPHSDGLTAGRMLETIQSMTR